MNADDLNLRVYTIYFLNELDTTNGFVRYYKKGLARRYKDFCTRNPAAKRFEFGDMLSYMKSRKYMYINRQQIVLKPLFIHLQPEQLLIFTVNPGSETSGDFYVCQVCDRGFSSYHGLVNHQTSDSHEQQLQLLLQFVPSDNHCPMLNCNFRGRNRNDVLKHFKEGKSIRVKQDPQTDQMLLEDCKARNAYCTLCRVRCTSDDSLQQHMLGRKHRINEFRTLYRENRPKLIQHKGGIEVKFENTNEDEDVGAVLSIIGDQNVKRRVNILIRNTVATVDFVACKQFYIYDTKTVGLSDRSNVSQGATCSIRSGGTYMVTVVITPTQFGKIRIPVLFIFRRSGEEYKILREIVYQCVPDVEVFAQIQPIAPYVKPKVERSAELEIVHTDVKPSINNKVALERIVPLKQHYIEPKLRQCVEYVKADGDELEAEERWAEIARELGVNSLHWSTYARYFNNLMYLEEVQMEIDIAQYTMEEVSVRKEASTGLIVIKIPGLAENRPSVLKGDKLYIVPPSHGKKYEGIVQKVELDSVKVAFNRSSDQFISKMKVRVEFTINRFSLRLEHRAVSEENIQKVLHMLFPSAQPTISHRVQHFKFYSRKVEENLEQNAAVRHIVNGTSVNAPYLIYGPPGTGKTSTLVEAIKQVCSCIPGCRILVCAPQNAAADLLAERLLEHVDKRDILRINAPSRSYEDVKPTVRSISNYAPKAGAVTRAGGSRMYGPVKASSEWEVEFPKREILKQRKILVSTLVTSGRLVSAEMTKHFTHIFIDEAGHATEPETVIPLSGLLDGTSVQVVLAGDPKQLGPVIRSPMATNLGKSMLERLMDCDLYRKDERSGEFNPDYVTKLVRSFRSHPEILDVPNCCFYDNELQAHADKMQRERFCNWEELPKTGFPLVFHGVDGHEEREGKSPSWFNTYEVMQVVAYVKLLMDCKSPKVKPQDIGIISPYHQQVNKILRGLKALETQVTGRTRNYDQITVGSVEKFQGSEREIIIISTVRSQDMYLTHDKDFNLGFVGNPKRFNVAVTRAKALLIVIGNPAILRRDKNWLRLISHIEEGGGYVGNPPPDETEDGEMEDLTQMMQSINIQDALSGASEYQQQANQEWRRKE